MAIDFPNSPTNGQTFTSGVRTWQYDGFKWQMLNYGAQGPQGNQGFQGNQGVQGTQGTQGNQGFGGLTTSIGFASANWYMPIANSIVDYTPVDNLTSFLAFYVSNTTTFDRIACRTGATWSAGTVNTRLGIYNNSNGKPTTVLLDAGQVACSAANTTYTITINQSLNEGWYWLAGNAQGTAAGKTWRRQNTQAEMIVRQDGNFGVYWGWAEYNITGAFATATPTQESNTMAVGLRVV